MPLNRAYKDPDIMPSTQYIVPPTHVAKKFPFKPWELSKFKPFIIDNFNDYGRPCLPLDVNISDPYMLFNLLFIDKIVDKLVEWTNSYIEDY
jgi:hypothetical protein